MKFPALTFSIWLCLGKLRIAELGEIEKMQLQVGANIENRYRLDRHLGSGAWGAVFLAEDIDLGRQVAIKFLHRVASDESLSVRFEREAKALSQLLHPNIVRVYRFGLLEDRTPFLVMEYVAGQSLRDLLEKKKQLNCQDAVRIARQICSALEYAHSAKIIHRDIKPENLMVSDTAMGTTVKLLDFGLCKLADEQQLTGNTLTKTGSIIGTAIYMSPEQCMGKEVDWRTDIYSFAFVLHEMLTGNPPFMDEAPAAILLKHLSDPMPALLDLSPRCGLPQDLNDLLLKCGSKSKEQRPQSFSEIGKVLDEIEKLNCTKYFDRSAKPRRTAGLGIRLPKDFVRNSLIGISIFSVSILGFLFATDSGKIMLSKQIESNLLPDDAIASLSKLLDSSLAQGNTKAAAELLQTSLNSTKFKSWSLIDREQLLKNYILTYHKYNLDNGALPAKIALLTELLNSVQEQAIKKSVLDIDPKEIEKLNNLCKELSQGKFSRREWSQISYVLDSHDKFFRKGPLKTLMWGYLLKCDAVQKRGMLDDEIRGSVTFFLAAAQVCEAQKEYLLMSKILDDCERLCKRIGEYSRLVEVYTFRGTYYLNQGRLEDARKQLQLAKTAALGSVVKDAPKQELSDLELSCKIGKLVHQKVDRPAYVKRENPLYSKVLNEEDRLRKDGELQEAQP